MNPNIKLSKPLQTGAAEAVKATERLRARLLLVFGILVLCTIAIEYAVIKLDQTGYIKIRTASLMFTVLALPVYFIVFLIREHFDTWRQRKRIHRMVAMLSAHLSAADVASAKQRIPDKPGEALHAAQTDTLVQEIVQVING